MRKIILFLFLPVLYNSAVAQSSLLEDSLKRELARASLPEDRIIWMRELAQYYMGVNNQLADDYGNQMTEMADSSRNRKLMIRACLYNAQRYYGFSALQQSVTKGLAYAQQALDLARHNNLDEYIGWSYIQLARGMRANGENDKALNYNNLALSIATGTDNDSLKVNACNSLGNTYLNKNEKLLAFRNYLQALNVAEATGRQELMRTCYSALSDFYASLEDYERAKDFVAKKEALEIKYNQKYDLLETYSAIGALYVRAKQYDQGRKYYEKALALADSLQFEVYKINCYVSIVNLYLFSQQYQKGLEYFNAHPAVSDFMRQAGFDYYIDQAYGSMYTFMNKLDSGGYYLKKAEPYFERGATKNNKCWFYANVALYYRKKNDFDNAILYWDKSKKLGEEIGSLNILQAAAQNLDTLYQLKGDYKNAHLYNSLYHQYKDSLQQLAKEKDMMTLEIDNENKRKEREIKLQQEETRRRHNIQYMAITIAIAGIFILLVMAGVFSVSRTTIKILGFFAFIFLFEFIILIADNMIHAFTHGEPWKIMIIKIALIAILLPLHHWLEEKVIHYLTNQELLRMKGKGLWGKWFKKKDADLPIGNL
jgi:tetratricopeptide (TPR) repeat protein